MTLDPLLALSVVASVFQVVDYASSIISKGKYLYKSADGALRENAEAETVTVRLRELTENIGFTSVQTQVTDAEERQLHQICIETKSISEALYLHLIKLKVPRGHEGRKWKSFRQALKTVWSKPDLDRLAGRLAELGNGLDTQLLRKFEYESLRQDRRFKEQDDASCALMRAFLETRNVQSEELQAHFETFTQSQRREHLDTRTAFVRLDGEKRRYLVERDILFSLKFPQIHDRYDQIAKAHDNTFTWIFREPQANHKPWDNFIKWILDGSGIYWGQGKAASGKSMLMRYIWNHGRTTQALRTWSSVSQLTISSFFFWNSGIPEQRTQTGLLRSLLYETLNDHKDLVPDVFPEESQTKSDSVARDQMIIPEAWSLPRLQKAFRRLIGLSSQHLKLCFFIDGLDEYEGEPEDIAQNFKDLSLCSVYIYFCLSSRLWPVFQDIYQNTPGLNLQDLTYDDIKLYVHDKLEKTDRMQRLSVTESQNFYLLVEELVQEAAGIFLWGHIGR